jgi:hypothetical protein
MQILAHGKTALSHFGIHTHTKAEHGITKLQKGDLFLMNLINEGLFPLMSFYVVSGS